MITDKKARPGGRVFFCADICRLLRFFNGGNVFYLSVKRHLKILTKYHIRFILYSIEKLFSYNLIFMIMDSKIENISHDATLWDMKGWQLSSCSWIAEFDTLWKMFCTVVSSSSYGTSDFGGPVWFLDFSIANLKKFYPDNPWLLAMEQEWHKGKWCNGSAKSDQLNSFSRWFKLRADCMIMELGLGNVIVKYESDCDNVCLYGNGVFLDVVRSLVNGEVRRPSKEFMLESNFSLRESEIVRKGKFLTCLKSESMWPSFPGSFGSGIHYVRTSDVYGKCYLLNHFSLTTGYVVPETVKEKFLMLVVNDLMEAKAQGYGNKADAEGTVCPYPEMKFDRYLDDGYCWCDNHLKPTSRSNVFVWRCQNGSQKRIKITLPQIDAKYGEFWHRQFPPKQNWRVLEEA